MVAHVLRQSPRLAVAVIVANVERSVAVDAADTPRVPLRALALVQGFDAVVFVK